MELSLPLPTLLLRGTVIYFAVMLVVRVLPKRTLGDNSPGDMLALIVIGALIASGMSVGADAPADFLVLAGVVAGWDWVLNVAEHHVPWLERVTSDAPSIIVEDGACRRRVMRRELITEDELMTCVRRSGLERIEDVARATVETTGEITIIPKPGTRTGNLEP